MNIKISLSVFFAFLITFSIFYIISMQTPNPDSKENISKFFNQNFNEKNKIFLIGSSYVGEMNSTHVNEIVSKKFPNFVVYNLAYGGDNPNKRIIFLDKIIDSEPAIIFYGISFYDLAVRDSPERDDPLPNPKQLLHSIFEDDIDPMPLNPKLITLQNLRNQFNNLNLFSNSEVFYLPYSPFMIFQSYHTIIDHDLHYSSPSLPFDPVKLNNFNNIIKKLSENNIPVVIFTTPHHKSFLDAIPDSQKQYFENFLLNSTNQFNLNLYDFTYNYQNLSIWRNPTHVAYNTESLIYSEDIGSMIISELEQ